MKKKNRLLRFAFILAFLVSLGLGNELWAQDQFVWTGAVSTAWNNAGNWTETDAGGTDTYPGEGNETNAIVTIPYSATNQPSLDQARQIGTLTITAGTTAAQHTILNLGGFVLTVTTTAAITGDATVASDARILMTTNSSGLLVGTTLTMGGTTGNAVINSTGAANQITVGTITTIGANSTLTLTNSGSANAFTGNVILSATTSALDLTGSTATFGALITSDGTGTITTDASTDLTFTGSPTLNFDTEDIGDLTLATNLQTVTLGADLHVNGNLTVSEATAAAVTLATGNYDFEVTGTTSVGASDVISFGTGTKTFTGVVTLTATSVMNLTSATSASLTTSSTDLTGLTTNAATDLTLTAGGAVSNYTSTAANSLTLNGAGLTLSLPASYTLTDNLTITQGVLTAGATLLTVGGDLTIATTHTLDVNSCAAFTVSGSTTVTAAGILTLTSATATFGDFTTTGAAVMDIGAATIEFSGATSLHSTTAIATPGTANLTFSGTGSTTLPVLVTALDELTISKPAGNVKLGADFTAINALTINNTGNLDLNGFNIILAATGVISETSSGSIINTGAISTDGTDNGFVTTASTSVTNINASGIGLTITAPTSVTATVVRYPQSIGDDDDNSSVVRIYKVTTDANITASSFAYNTNELVLNKNLTLELYSCATIDGTFSKTGITSTNTTSGTVSTSSNVTTSTFYTFFGEQVSTSGYSKIFTGATSSVWATDANWLDGVAPTSADSVLIPTGKHVSLAAAGAARSITLEGNATLTLNNALTLAGAAAGSIILNDNSGLVINHAGPHSIGSATYKGDIVQNDNSTVTLSTAATINMSGTWTLASNASITNTAPLTLLNLTGTTAFTLPSDISSVVGIEVNKTGSTPYVDLAGSFATTTGAVTLTAGTLRTNGYTFTSGAATSIASGATLDATGRGTSLTTNTFTGAITNNGTLIARNATNVFTAAYPDAATTATLSYLYIDNSLTSFGGTLGADDATALYAKNATITVTGVATFSGVTEYFDERTNLTLTTAPVAFDVTTLGDFTLNTGTTTLTTDLSVYGNLDFTGAAQITVNGKTLTVYGTYDPTGGTVVATAALSKVVLYGPIAAWGTFTTDVNSDLEIRGTGTITPATLDQAAVGDVVLDRAGATLAFDGGAGNTLATLTVTKGTVTAENGQAFTVSGATTIYENGTLDVDVTTAATRTFNGLAGTGVLSCTGASGQNATLAFASANAYTFTGTLTTNGYTVLDIDATHADDLNIPESVSALYDMQITRGALAKRVVLNNDLELTLLVTPNTNWVSGTLVVNGYNLNVTKGIATGAAAATFALDITKGSTLTIGNTTTVFANFTNCAVTEDETSNIILVGTEAGAAAVTAFNTAISTLKNLTISLGSATSATLTTSGDLAIFGDLTIGSTCTFSSDNDNLTVYGNVTNAGTINISGGTGIISLYGSLTNSGTITTSVTLTELTITGTGTQFSMPSGITNLFKLKVERPSGVKLNADLTIGAAGTNGLVTLTKGDLDLNGYDVTLAYTGGAGLQLSETIGNTVINTGTAGAYVTTASIAIANANASGIGVSEIAGPATVTIQRIPQSASISGTGNSISRIYYLVGDASFTKVKLAYEDAELNGNRAAALKAFANTNSTFTGITLALPADDAGVNTATNANGLRYCTYTAGTGTAIPTIHYVTLASTTTGTGVAKTFSNTAGTNDWNTAANWSPVGVPTYFDEVVIPTGFTVTVSANIEANNITINGNSTLALGANAMQVAGNLTVNSISGSAFTVGEDAAVIIGGNLINATTGTITLSHANGSYLYIGGAFENQSTGAITVNGETYLTLNGSTSSVLPTNISTLHSLIVNKTSGQTVTVASALNVEGTNSTDVLSGELIIADDAAFTTVNLTVANGAKFTAQGTAARTITGNISVDGTGEIDMSGTGTRTLGNAAVDVITIAPTTAGSVMNLENSSVTFNSQLSFGFASTLNLKGAAVTLAGAAGISFTNGALQADANTDLTISGAKVITGFPALTNLQSLTISGATTLALASDLTLADGLTLSAGVLDIGARTLTINDALNNSGGTIEYIAGSKLVTNGVVTAWGTFNPAVTTNLDLTVGGTGTLADVSFTELNDVVMNRAGETLTFTTAATIGGNLTVSSGTVKSDVDADFTVTGTTLVEGPGTLDIQAGTKAGIWNRNFNGAVNGSGIINASGAATMFSRPIFDGEFSFTGTLTTNAYTDLYITSAQTSDFSVPSSVSTIRELRIDRDDEARTVTLNGDLTIKADLTRALLEEGTLVMGTNTVTFDGAFNFVAAGDAMNFNAANTSLVFNEAANFTELTVANSEFTADETTSFTFGGAALGIVAFPRFTNLNNITMSSSAARTLSLDGALTLAGNLTINAFGVVNLDDNNLTVNGAVSNLGTFDMDGNGTAITVNLKSSMQGTGIYSSGTETILQITGTSEKFQMPVQVTTLGRLELDRANGMAINEDLVVGDGVDSNDDIKLISGDLDINGNILTLADGKGRINEAAGATIVNTGATSATTGYVVTATATGSDLLSSGIGITNFGTNNAANFTVKRYPKSVPVTGVGISAARYYVISTSIPTPTVAQPLKMAYDNTEVGSNASSLRLFTSDSDALTTFEAQTNTAGSNRRVYLNTPSGKGYVEYTEFVTNPLDGHYYVLSAEPGSGGVMKTYAGATNGNWGTASNWSPSGVPTENDDVVIGPYTVVVNGNGASYKCKTLLLNNAASELRPNNNGSNGDEVTLIVYGNITLNQPGSSIEASNGYGRLNIQIGDGTTAGISSSITTSNNYTSGAGLSVNDFTVNAATVAFGTNAYDIRIIGDLTLVNNAAFDGAGPTIVFYGGNGTQTITVPSSAELVFEKVKLENNASVVTSSDFIVENELLVKSGSSLIASNGTIKFLGTIIGWRAENGSTFRPWNVEIAATGNTTMVPVGNVEIQGNFVKADDYVTFSPASDYIIFRNTTQKEITNSGTAAKLNFYNLRVSSGSAVATTSSFQVTKEVDVLANASLKATNGTITMAATADWIKNVSTQTLEFYNLAVAGTVQTNDSWKILGGLSVTGSLLANAGTITFENSQERTITNSGTLRFFKLYVADGSKVKTSNANNSFTVQNNATTPSGAGIEVAGSGQFNMDASSTITFSAAAGVPAGYPKVITKSSAGTMTYGNIAISAVSNNEVSTASDFTISGNLAGAFTNSGAGAIFDATAGTVTFTGSTPSIVTVSPAVSNFFGIKTTGAATLTTTNAQDIHIRGNLTVDGTSKFIPGGTTSKVIFDGSANQIISGSSTTADPIQFADLTINKGVASYTSADEVTMQANVKINSNGDHRLTLTNGILNIGSKTLTVGAGLISRFNGVINGGTGTYVIASSHETPKLSDAYFTVSDVATLYNLQVDAAHTTANDLTVNGILNLNLADLTIASGSSATPKLLTLNGTLTRNSGEIAGSVTHSKLVLTGTGTVSGGLSNTYFDGAAATTVRLEIARPETLSNNLSIAGTSSLDINTGINTFDLATYTLTFVNNSTINMKSGSIKAGQNSSVVFPASITTIPASMFYNNEAYNLTFAAGMTLLGDLTVNGILSGLFTITTGDNTLTFGSNSTVPSYNSTAYINGNLVRTVKSTATVFPLGDASGYRPVTLTFATAGSEQAVKVSSTVVDPTIGRAGNPKNAVNVLWTIAPQGTNIDDQIKARFDWPTDLEYTSKGGQTAVANASFPAKWMGTYWYDYRNSLNAFAVVNPRNVTMSSFAIASPSALAGEWAVFNASANTDAAKDAAINTSEKRIVITSVTPTPMKVDQPFSMTVQLQDQYGQPLTAANEFELSIREHQGTAFNSGTPLTAKIPAGQSYVTINGVTFTGTAAANVQLLADTTGGSDNWQPVLSSKFNVIQATPATQASGIAFTNVKETSMTVTWTPSTDAFTYEIIIAKAGSLLTEDEFPVDGITYQANSIYGAGTSIGNAVVIYKGDGPSVNVTGLAPNTTYYFYAFTFKNKENGGLEINGTEAYKTTAASKNPNFQKTTGSDDDDVSLGSNDTRTTSKTIGTNTPVTGTISSATDEDWFNFTVTNASPNVRSQLYGLSNNYNIEVYDMSGRRIRRGIRTAAGSEGPVVNNLPAGTYTVRIYSADGSYSTTNTYTLKVGTKSSEIFSVTP